MGTTTPDNIYHPEPEDRYNLVPHLAQMAVSVQSALINKGDKNEVDAVKNSRIASADTSTGDLIITTIGGETINAGTVVGQPGEPGEPGEPGPPGTFAGASAETVPATEPASVEMSGPPEARTVHFRIPAGPEGTTPDLDFLLTVLDPGDEPTLNVTQDGDVYTLNIGLPPAPELLAEAVPLPSGSAPTVTFSGDWPTQTLTLGIPAGPAGEPGPPASITASATTLPPGSEVDVEVSGTAPNYHIDFGIPRGDTGSGSVDIDDDVISTESTWSSSKIDAADEALRVGKANTTHTHSASQITSGLLSASRIPAATSAQATAGESTSVFMNPLRTKEAITALAPPPATATETTAGISRRASNAEALAGENEDAYMTPFNVAAVLDNSSFAVINDLAVATSTTWSSSKIDQTQTSLAQQVVSALSLKANVSHTHAAADVNSGTFSVDRLPVATSAEAVQGTSNTKVMSPLRTAEAIAALAPTEPVRNRCVIVGSSNAVSGTDMWGAKLCAAMGWIEHNYAIGGTSYTTSGSGQNFQGQLTTARNALTTAQRAEVGHVIICDASNNARAKTAYGTVKTAAAAAYAYAAAQFPNARIVVVPMIWPSDTEKYWPTVLGGYDRTVLDSMSRVVSAQRDAAADISRVTFIEETWTWLTGRDEMMGSLADVHPGAVGNTFIANLIAKALRGESPRGAGAWTECSPLSGFTLGGGTGEGQARRLSAFRDGWDVQINGAIATTDAAPANTDWGTVPYGFRPSYITHIAGRIPAQGNTIPVQIWPNGVIRVPVSVAAGQTLSIDADYYIG